MNYPTPRTHFHMLGIENIKTVQRAFEDMEDIWSGKLTTFGEI